MPEDPTWTLAAAHDVHERLAQLTAARSSARANVRIAPRRWAQRAVVAAEDRRLARLHLLAESALWLVRAASATVEEGRSLPAALRRHIAALATAMSRLANTSQPWPPDLLSAVDDVTRRAIAQRSADRAGSSGDVASTLRTTARDLREITARIPSPGITVPAASPADEPRQDHVGARERA
jgi:hypothetical protein